MTAIVLGVDTPIGLTIVRELGRHGVEVCAVGKEPTSIGAASRHAKRFIVRPAGSMDAWLPKLIAEVGARALFAISEHDLLALAALPPTIGRCAILTPRAAQLAAVLDKTKTLEVAAGLGIDTPQSWQPGPTDHDDTARIDALAYPVVLKWSDPNVVSRLLATHGIELQKAEFADSPDALRRALARYDAIGRWPIVQTYCAGHGLGQMIHMHAGRAVLRFQHRRLHEWPPEGGVSTSCIAVPLDEHAEQMERSVALLQALAWDGPAMVEYRYDAQARRYWLMEINGRFWGSLPLASRCGAEFAWEGYRRHVLHDESAAPAPRASLRARYMIPETRRLVRVLFQRRAIKDPMFRERGWQALVAYVVDFLRPSMRYYVFRIDDPGPFLRDLSNVIRQRVLKRSS